MRAAFLPTHQLLASLHRKQGSCVHLCHYCCWRCTCCHGRLQPGQPQQLWLWPRETGLLQPRGGLEVGRLLCGYQIWHWVLPEVCWCPRNQKECTEADELAQQWGWKKGIPERTRDGEMCTGERGEAGLVAGGIPWELTPLSAVIPYPYLVTWWHLMLMFCCWFFYSKLTMYYRCCPKWSCFLSLLSSPTHNREGFAGAVWHNDKPLLFISFAKT